MEFYRNFLFEYCLMGIEKPKFTRRNEIWCRILEIEDLSKNVRKTQDRTSLNLKLYGIPHRSIGIWQQWLYKFVLRRQSELETSALGSATTYESFSYELWRWLSMRAQLARQTRFAAESVLATWWL